MIREPDVVVIGAGVGGLCAAALLAHRGRRIVVVERLDRIGGRASTEEVEGFLVNTGAVGLELGGEMQALFEEVGAAYRVPEPHQPIAVRIRGRTVNVSHPAWRWLIDGVLLRGGGVLARRAWPEPDGGSEPEFGLACDADAEAETDADAEAEAEADADAETDADAEESFADWLGRHTQNQTLHRAMRNVSAGLLSVNPHEVSARAMITYFTQKGGFRRFGYVPGGTISAWRALAGAIERDGGEVWLNSEATGLTVSDRRVSTVSVRRNGTTVDLQPAQVISNIGPGGTIGLCGDAHFPAEYRARVSRDQRSAAMICFHLASRTPLMGAAGLVFFADTERLCALAYLTASAPDLAPSPDWHVYIAAAVPDPAVGPFDEPSEIERAWSELVREVPRAAQARLITTRVMRDDWPCQRAVLGRDLPQRTPIANLWNVGDAARPYPNAGTQGCAESARRAVDSLIASAPLHDPSHR